MEPTRCLGNETCAVITTNDMVKEYSTGAMYILFLIQEALVVIIVYSLRIPPPIPLQEAWLVLPKHPLGGVEEASSYTKVNFLTKNYKFWTSRGINGPKPIVLFGTFYQNFFKPMTEVAVDNSTKYGKVYGGFFGTRPFLMISDPKLVKEIMIKDFHLFADRDDMITGDSLNDRSLFNLKGDEWKNMRSIISPTFSSGKMRSMHPIISNCVKNLEKQFETSVRNGKQEIELKKMMSNLTMDVISQCAFGTELDIYGGKTSDFITYAQKIVQPSFRLWFVFLMVVSFPKFIQWTGMSLQDPGASTFFRAAIRSIISRRKSDKTKQRDYLQLILNAQNKTLDTTDEPDVEGDKSDQIYGETDQLKDQKINKSKIPSEDYKLGDTGITIPKGTTVDVDIQSIHHNPEYYPNPDRWDPERFMPENRDQLVPYTYMPFGMGPRNCVGMRFALMEAKTAIAHLVNKYLTRNFNYWKSRGIDGPKPIALFGTFYQIFFKPNPIVVLENARKYGNIHGAFLGNRPMLCIADPDLIRDIAIKDFHVFVDHNDFQSGDPFSDRSLFNLMGDEWRKMRSIISPTFSSGKMRSMHPIVTDCVHRLENYLMEKVINNVRHNKEIELKKAMSDLTMDVITSCAFGTQLECKYITTHIHLNQL
ncbi:unnamed protein product [Medioppia subpectinata]|uniref:Cytochrome P450 n=1 Tax=Medioppia subpectinata TaxID=1979941 RepID=A0A7R9KHL7_9ACAR|nr:unnamed protein product [Medioppia subpectinata]CAG2103506.1 unnamed protein product [Medioppia subpectinata]